MGAVIRLPWLVCIAVPIVAVGCSHAHPEPELQVVNILNAQADAWNRGELDRFMGYYWKSDDLACTTNGQTTQGWAATAAFYRKHYPTPEDRGRLEYDEIQIQPLAKDAILVVGRWSLDGDPEARGGTFSRVFRRIDDHWVIAHEHLSPSAPEPQSPH